MADGGFDVNGPDSEGISGGFRINVVPKGAWQSPPGVVFGTPGQVYADNRFPYLDHLKSVVDLQKEAFLTEMCVEEKSAKEPFAMGLDEETYFMIVELPCWLMVMFAALAIVTMIQRWQAGKPLMPFGASCEGYASVDVDAAGLGEGGLDGGQAGSVPYSRGEVFQPGRQAGQAGPTGASGGPSGTSGAAPSSGAASAPGKKEPLPYERIPTPGAAPYLWSPPPTIFQPSPTPAGTPFIGSPGGAGPKSDADDVGDEFYTTQGPEPWRQRR